MKTSKKIKKREVYQFLVNWYINTMLFYVFFFSSGTVMWISPYVNLFPPNESVEMGIII